MQDIHWPGGSFGYFPSYTLGSMYAAHFFASIRSGQPDLDAQLLGGNLLPVFKWLEQHIWRQASRWSIDDLVKRARVKRSIRRIFVSTWSGVILQTDAGKPILMEGGQGVRWADDNKPRRLGCCLRACPMSSVPNRPLYWPHLLF